MIKLENVNKYFNKRKKNEIHVINNTTLEFPSKGLVSLLGPSGCGKTTLLNVIGGLDKINSGNIFVDGKKITKRSSTKVDEIRNLNIGYIFQDYKLVDSMTVFENVELVLKIIGVKNKDEIEKRVLYTLDKVNMLRYKNRPVNMLSGGERQRVGIARALVKNPKIIIADEPTGNLDSKNSLEVMDIIKSISENYLVILVTHEEELARFYSDRIVELVDGKITKDYLNEFEGSLNYKVENRIYLKDFKDCKNITTNDGVDIKIYSDDKEKIKLDIVFKNGNIYIKSHNKEKVEIVEGNSNIEFINDHYKEIDKSKLKKDTFKIDEIVNKKYSSIFKIGEFIKYGFKKILNYPILKKILLGGFFLSGMFIYYSVASISASLKVEDKDFISMNRDYLIVENINGFKVEDYLNYEKEKSIEYILPSNSVTSFGFIFDLYNQTSRNFNILNGSISNANTIEEKDLIYGNITANDYEVVIDKLVLDKFISNNSTEMAGFFKPEDFLNHYIYSYDTKKLKIVGITNKEEPNIYVKEEMFINLINDAISDNSDYRNEKLTKFDSYDNEFRDYKLFEDNLKIVKGSLPKNDYEIIMPISREMDYELGKETNIKINNHKLKVVGFYKLLNGDTYNNIITNSNTIKYKLIENSKAITIKSNDKKSTIKYFRHKNMNIKESYESAKNEYIETNKECVMGSLLVSGVMLGISLVEILLMIRSSFMSRIKEVGIYRAIGVKKKDIYKMFSGEIIAITTVASVTGITFMAYILNSLKSVSFFSKLFNVNIITYISSILIVFIFNLIIGLLPVWNTIRKTPAEILSRLDVD